MRTLLILIKKDLLDQFRSKKIIILIFTFLFVAISSVVIAKVLPQILGAIPSTPGLIIDLPTPTYKDAIDQFVKNLSQLAIFVLVFLVAGAIADEKNKKTLELVLTKPVSRSLFVLSKFKAYFLSITAIYLISALIFYFYTCTTFAVFGFGHFFLMTLLILIYLILICAATIFFSTILTNSILAAVGGFGTMIILGTIWGLIDKIKDYSPYQLVSNYQNIIASGWDGNLLWPLIISLLLIIVFVLSSMALFRQQEVER